MHSADTLSNRGNDVRIFMNYTELLILRAILFAVFNFNNTFVFEYFV